MLPIFRFPKSSAELLSRSGMVLNFTSLMSLEKSLFSTVSSFWYFDAFTIGEDRTAPTQNTMEAAANKANPTFVKRNSINNSFSFTPLPNFLPIFLALTIVQPMVNAKIKNSRHCQNPTEWMFTAGRAI